MKVSRPFYRRNILLVIVFCFLIVTSLALALVLAFNLTKKYVENEFSSKKIDVLEETMQPYTDFFQNKIPEISFYQGFMDSSSVAKYVDTVLSRYPFVNRVIFYDVEVSNHHISDGFRANRFSMGLRAVFQFGRQVPADSVSLFKMGKSRDLSLKTATEFNKIAVKFAGYIESIDTSKAVTNESFNVFYNISANLITYMNIPRREEMRIFKDLMQKKQPPSPIYEQDVLSFYLNPFKLQIKNAHAELYRQISIKPLTYETLDTNPDLITTDIPLPGAFADYKLYFVSSKQHLSKEIIRRFFPVASVLMLIYLILGFIAYLIFRNLYINRKMFKLQYDFINNLTHEFKTPVSVIKIAGNNIRSAKELSDPERLHYGKILDEEADKLNDLMNKLLSFTQIENRSILLKEELIDLEVFTSNIIDGYKLRYPDFNITCKIKNIELFKSDPVLLTSLFQNLIDNAYKYSLPEDKRLKITISRVKRNVVFSFKDEGIGIAKNEVDHIFKKFYRIQNQFNQQGSVGLGLAFCKELVNFMNGNISVSSKLGKGSEFVITLPYLA